MRILGLDLGVASIGWALIDIDEITYQPLDILGLGSRIVPLSDDDTKSFTAANKPTPTAQRTFRRTARKMLERWKQRRKHLLNRLHALGMYDRTNPLNDLPPLKLWELRAKAADPECRLTLEELGRVIIHLSSKRGYQHSRKSSDAESKDTKYVAAINQRYAHLKESGLTMGQWLYRQLKDSEIKNQSGKGSIVTYRIKEGDADNSNLLPRKAHEDELRRILHTQQAFYPEILTDQVIDEIFNIVFYQRPLKSCKNLVNRCEMFDFRFKNARGKEVNCSPRVAPRTSPVVQLTRIWEAVNNLRLVSSRNKVLNEGKQARDIKSKDYRKTLEYFQPTLEEKRRIVDYLNTNEKLTSTALLKLLGLKRSDGFKPETNISTGIKGNQTYLALFAALEGYTHRDELLRFEPEVCETVDKETGEVRLMISADVVNQPLYKLWHLIYSVPDEGDLKRVLREQFDIDDEVVLDRLAAIDFTTPGFSNRSVKFMRRILPYLIEGDMYSVACEKAGFRHSDYLTTAENDARVLASKIRMIDKGELRQPLVEKVLNQMIQVVNEIIRRFGPIDEIRVELARELKQSKDQRIKAGNDISANEKVNQANARKIQELGVPVNRRTLQKYRLWEETGHRCIYCGDTIGAAAFLSGELSEVEHIIPRSLFFDDSMSNKTCSCSLCNRTKGQMTAYDFMRSKGDQALLDFQHRVEELAEKKKISKTKLSRFLTSAKDIPQDFIERDLQQTRYISRKAMEILRTVARSVYASSGKVTDFFRNAWGYNRLLETLNLPRYEQAGMVEQSGSRKIIREWTKRLDHRHHAVDALTVALTRQGYVQRLSTLNASRDEMRGEVGDNYSNAYSLLEQWAVLRPHFSPSEVMKKLSEVGVSFKAGKKATAPGFKTSGDRRLNVPRGPLHEETIYGRIWLPDGKKPLGKCLELPETIADQRLRKAVADLMAQFGGDVKAVKKHLKKSPLLMSNGEPVEQVAVRRQEYVKREAIASLKPGQIDKIVDDAVREAVRRRFEECGSEKAFQQSFADHPLCLPGSVIPIKRVTRCTGLSESSMVAVKRHNGEDIGFAKSGSNHHIAFYMLPDGKVKEMVTSFWTAAKRRKVGLPAVISDPDHTWQLVELMCDQPDLEEVVASLPPVGARMLFSLATNEMVLLGLTDDQLRDAIETNDMATLAAHLYRVQILTASDYTFRHHTHTISVVDEITRQTGNSIRINSWGALMNSNITKVSVDRLGNIIIPANG